MNINDYKNVTGMASIYSDTEDLQLNEYENTLTGLNQYTHVEPTKVDYAKEFSNELEKINIGETTNLRSRITTPAGFEYSNQDMFGSYARPASTVPFSSSTIPSTYKPQTPISNVPSYNMPSYNVPSYNMPSQPTQSYTTSVSENAVYNYGDNTDMYEDDEEEKMSMIDQCDFLKQNLNAEGIDISNIKMPETHMTKREIYSILRRLQIKNDKLRYCDVFEEFILAGAYMLEGAFDGNNEYFGSKIDLTGYPETVKVKLRRMRYNTSNFVSDIMRQYQMNHGFRIALELLPSLLLYSRDRKQSIKTKDTLHIEADYKKAINSLSV